MQSERLGGQFENENYNLANELQANELAFKFLRSFGLVSKTLWDNEHYIDAICDAFMDYSIEDGEEAIKRIVRTCGYPPVPATVRDHLKAIVNERRGRGRLNSGGISENEEEEGIV